MVAITNDSVVVVAFWVLTTRQFKPSSKNVSCLECVGFCAGSTTRYILVTDRRAGIVVTKPSLFYDDFTSLRTSTVNIILASMIVFMTFS
jgi:hypothetical protein